MTIYPTEETKTERLNRKITLFLQVAFIAAFAAAFVAVAWWQMTL